MMERTNSERESSDIYCTREKEIVLIINPGEYLPNFLLS